jgi:uncharacterized protein involved in outer membrane biogenesis
LKLSGNLARQRRAGVLDGGKQQVRNNTKRLAAVLGRMPEYKPGGCEVRKLLVGMALALVVIITAVIIVPFVIPVAAYKDWLIALVEQATGREAQIAGPMRLSLLPALTIKANDVSFGNAPGALVPQMARLKELRIELQVLPLFHSALVVKRLVLVEPVISLESTRPGTPTGC